MIFISLNYAVKNFEKQINKDDFSRYVVGVDIGGTNTNLGIAGIQNTKTTLLFSLSFKSQELPSLIPAVNEILAYAKENYNIEAAAACVGAAGVVTSLNDFAKLTNVEWDVSTKELLRETSLHSAFIINDFQAVGYGINLLDPNNKNDMISVKPQHKNNQTKSTKAIIGAGTGLGKSILVYNERFGAYFPIPSEGGHSDFPPRDNLELELLDFIKNFRSFSQPVTYEELLSGRGLVSIYNFLREREKFKATEYTKEIDNLSEKASLISKYKEVDETCAETFRLFARFYGRCAKNFVLDTLATGGLYIAGGIAAKNKEIFASNEFFDEFEDAYRRTEILKEVPVYVIVNYDVGLYGSCFAAMYKSYRLNEGLP